MFVGSRVTIEAVETKPKSASEVSEKKKAFVYSPPPSPPQCCNSFQRLSYLRFRCWLAQETETWASSKASRNVNIFKFNILYLEHVDSVLYKILLQG